MEGGRTAHPDGRPSRPSPRRPGRQTAARAVRGSGASSLLPRSSASRARRHVVGVGCARGAGRPTAGCVGRWGPGDELHLPHLVHQRVISGLIWPHGQNQRAARRTRRLTTHRPGRPGSWPRRPCPCFRSTCRGFAGRQRGSGGTSAPPRLLRLANPVLDPLIAVISARGSGEDLRPLVITDRVGRLVWLFVLTHDGHRPAWPGSAPDRRNRFPR